MNQFEKEFEEKFPVILKRGGAFLFRLHPPMRVAGMRGSQPMFLQVGRALFDVAGWVTVQDQDADLFRIMGTALPASPVHAIMVGIELKETSDSHASLRIVGDDGSGSGLQAHQLEALASVHRAGGIARVLWSNGGRVGVLDGEEIAAAHFTYGVSVQAEKMRKKPALGSRSIPWKLFREIDLDKAPESVIFMPAKSPTLDEERKAKKKKTARQIQEADDAPVDPADIPE